MEFLIGIVFGVIGHMFYIDHKAKKSNIQN